VLSFPLYDDFSEIIENECAVPLGDIVISLERAARQGYDIGHSIYHEVAFLCVHSTLHLLGYDHETSKEDEEEMFQKQREIMEIIGF
jgi:probable rRNA maturation factor